MAERKPPVIGLNTPIGPDVDLEHEDVRLADGTRLTEKVAAGIVEEVRGKPVGREPELVPLRELAAELARELLRELKELRLWDRVKRELRHWSDVLGSHSSSGTGPKVLKRMSSKRGARR